MDTSKRPLQLYGTAIAALLVVCFLVDMELTPFLIVLPPRNLVARVRSHPQPVYLPLSWWLSKVSKTNSSQILKRFACPTFRYYNHLAYAPSINNPICYPKASGIGTGSPLPLSDLLVLSPALDSMTTAAEGCIMMIDLVFVLLRL